MKLACVQTEQQHNSANKRITLLNNAWALNFRLEQQTSSKHRFAAILLSERGENK